MQLGWTLEEFDKLFPVPNFDIQADKVSSVDLSSVVSPVHPKALKSLDADQSAVDMLLKFYQNHMMTEQDKNNMRDFLFLRSKEEVEALQIKALYQFTGGLSYFPNFSLLFFCLIRFPKTPFFRKSDHNERKSLHKREIQQFYQEKKRRNEPRFDKVEQGNLGCKGKILFRFLFPPVSNSSEQKIERTNERTNEQLSKYFLNFGYENGRPCEVNSLLIDDLFVKNKGKSPARFFFHQPSTSDKFSVKIDPVLGEIKKVSWIIP